MSDDKPLLVVLIDAFRHDFLDDERTPNLAKLAADGLARPLRPILGYSDAIRATAFTGRYPDETGYWMEYCYRPDSSPWAGMSKLGFLDQVPSDLLLRGLKMAGSATAMKALAKRRGFPHLSVRNIPFRALEKFDFTIHQPMTSPNALGFPSIFDECNASGKSWVYLDASEYTKGDRLLTEIENIPTNVGLIFVYLHQIDQAAHLFGIESDLFQRRVAFTDDLFGKAHKQICRRFGDVTTLIFSDHGMSQLTRQIAIPELTKHSGFPDRFFFALDATTLRLWYLQDDDRLREELRDLVGTRYPGHFLTDDEKKQHHLNFDNNLYGDDFYLLPQGTAIFPNFHSFIKPKAMHAYDPAEAEQWGIFIGPSATRNRISRPVELTEVTGVIMDALRADGVV